MDHIYNLSIDIFIGLGSSLAVMSRECITYWLESEIAATWPGIWSLEMIDTEFFLVWFFLKNNNIPSWFQPLLKENVDID